MKVIRPAFVLGGSVFCLLFLSLSTASAQQPYPRAYLFVEVKDTAGKRITDADVAVSRADGNQILNTKTGRDGITKTVFEQISDHHYNLQVSKTGYLSYEQVFFLYPHPDASRYRFISRVEDLSNSLEDLKNHESEPVRIVLHTTPVTSAERQAVELQDRKRQLLLAAKRGDPANLRRLLQAGLKADTVDAKGVPAIAWAALAGDAETIKVLCDAGANVRDKKKLGHQALLIYLSEGIFRANARMPGDYNTGTERPVLERQEETVRRLILREPALTRSALIGERY